MSGWQTGIIATVCSLFFFVLVVWLFNRIARTATPEEERRKKELSDEIDAAGIKAIAAVKKKDGILPGSTINATTRFAMILEVELPSGEKHEVSEELYSSYGMFSLSPPYSSYVAKIGARIPVEVHPFDHKVLRVDYTRLTQMMVGQ